MSGHKGRKRKVPSSALQWKCLCSCNWSVAWNASCILADTISLKMKYFVTTWHNASQVKGQIYRWQSVSNLNVHHLASFLVFFLITVTMVRRMPIVKTQGSQNSSPLKSLAKSSSSNVFHRPLYAPGNVEKKEEVYAKELKNRRYSVHYQPRKIWTCVL